MNPWEGKIVNIVLAELTRYCAHLIFTFQDSI